jgi:hypothetical protein
MQARKTFFALLVMCLFSAAYARSPLQDRGSKPQTRPAPGGENSRPKPDRPYTDRPNPSRPNPSPPKPGGGSNRPQPGRPDNGSKPPQRPNPGRPPQWGRPPASRPSSHFRPNDRSYLRQYYMRALLGINRANRPHFVMGGFFPYTYIPYLTPVPAYVYGYVPPPPPGYQMGYYDGYVVVYDPLTYFIASVVDLLQ